MPLSPGIKFLMYRTRGCGTLVHEITPAALGRGKAKGPYMLHPYVLHLCGCMRAHTEPHRVTISPRPLNTLPEALSLKGRRNCHTRDATA
jgi:hypothetical protein